jgi:hypothetical protein
MCKKSALPVVGLSFADKAPHIFPTKSARIVRAVGKRGRGAKRGGRARRSSKVGVQGGKRG